VRGFRAPLAVSIIGHSGVLALLALFAAQLPPAPFPQPRKSGIEVMLVPQTHPQATVEAPPPAPEPPPVTATEPPPPEPPPPPAPIPKPEPPPPPPKPVVHKPVMKSPPRPQPQPVREAPREPLPLAAPRVMPQSAPAQMALVPPAPMPAPAPRPAPTVSAGYRAMLSAWLEAHKRYPESARARGEEGRAVLRFRVDRSGRVLNYALASGTGFADLDAAIDAMMRGATLPPFPADMTASDVDVSVTVRFSLTR
jgi:periplasmic protein TonB